MKKLVFLLTLSIICLNFTAYTQSLRSFSDEDDKFLKQLKNHLTSGNKTEGKLLFDEFEQLWANGSFSFGEKDKIKKDCNLLLKKRGKAYPHFATYINIQNLFVNSGHDDDSRIEWQNALGFMLNKRTFQLSKIAYFLTATELVLETNSIYESPSAHWKCSSADYSFKFTEPTVSIQFDTIDLSCYSKNDSLKIYNTTGSYFPIEKNWKGTSGLVTWVKAGLSADSVFANLSNYNIDIKKSSFEADSAIFYHLGYSKDPMLGKFNDKTFADVKTNRISYPRFSSYQKVLTIKNIYPDINYVGGFSMRGNKFLSKSGTGLDAYLIISKTDTITNKKVPVLRCASSDFVFKKDEVTSINAAITIILEEDSIYHPGLSFRYIPEKREAHMTRSGEGMSRSSFYNSYHMVDMDFEQIIWNIDHPKIDFNMIRGGESRSGVFESVNYFSSGRYYGIQGMDKHHPYNNLLKFYNEFGVKEFHAMDYANFIRMPATDVRQQLMSLSYLGVIDYDVDNQKVILRDKLFYYLQAAGGRVDFDVIAFVSDPGKLTNASLSLLTKELKIYGVPQIQLSDSQNVIIYPVNEEITLKKNRDFDFEGLVSAGKFDFYGKKFSFSYNNFNINLDNIDSLRIWVEVYHQNGTASLTKVRTVIQDVTGNLLIDKPGNKSGREKFSEYPVFNSTQNSYVYYDRSNIQSGVYKRDNFYFQIDPYTIDSLDEFSTKALHFVGNFTSADIFPPFDEKLTVQNDLSLGFQRMTPPEGFPTYKGKGIYKNQIDLSNRGLRGNGELNYLTSTAVADDFYFYPDSTNTLAKTFDVKKQVASVEYPEVSGKDIFIHWLPYQDEMFASTNEVPFKMFNEADLTGGLKLEPIGLTGGGFMEFDNAELTADLYKYKANTFDSDSANFDLLTTDTDGFAFRTNNVSAHVDFIERTGRFELNDEETFVEIPPNEYICSMDVFDWYMDKEEIDMSVSWLTAKDKKIDMNADPFALVDSDQPGSEFISMHPLQDSLRFIASLANYKIKESLLTAYNVKTITVADATVLPGDGIVQIEKKAIMRTIEEAKIVANNDSKFHLLYNAEVNIFGRKNYNANADYDYIDEINRKQTLHFDVVAVDDSIRSYATGNITDSSAFTLSPNFVYQGDIRLNAWREFLTFDGTVKMNYDCERIDNNWLAFNSEIDPKEVMIPVSGNPLDIDDNKLLAGIMMKKDSTHLYTSFLNKPKKYSDLAVFPVEGMLYFDNTLREYQIGSLEKIQNDEVPGNLLRLSKDKCISSGEGKIDLGIYAGQVKIDAAGFINHDLVKDSVELNVMMILDFYFPKEVLDMVSTAIYNSPDLEPADLSADAYVKALPELIGEEQANEAFRNLSLYGEYKKMPKELDKSLVLSEVNLIWDSSTHSYISVGQIGIGNMGSTELNRYVDGKLEFVKTRSTNEFVLYLQVGFEKWYYFEYKRNTLFTVSSDEAFNFALKDMKPDRRRNEIKGEAPLSVVPANERKRRYFLQKFDIEEEEYDEEDDE